MLSPSPLKPSSPSVSLLRFLRSQSDYFTANTSSSPCLRSSSSRGPRTSNWVSLDPAPCRATVEASLFALPSLRLPTKRSSRGRCTTTITLDKTKPVQLSIPPSLCCSAPLGARASSTNNRPLLRRLFDFKRNKAAEAAKANRNPGPALIDDGTENSFNIGRGLVSKATNELRLRCTEFDINGNVTLVNGEFRKSELIAKVRLTFSVLWIGVLGTKVLICLTVVWSSS